jgi:beta-glucanase (GH16 family)
MRRRFPFMQAAATGAALALAFPLAVHAQSSAESASRTLNSEVRRDRARDGALDARAADRARATPATSPGARRIDEDRAAVGGRPEEFGRSPQSLRWTGYNSNIAR